MSKRRKGLNMLLERYPEADVQRIATTDHWTTVTLATSPPDPDLLSSFAIWGRTGDVYALDLRGAVADDPFLVVTAP